MAKFRARWAIAALAVFSVVAAGCGDDFDATSTGTDSELTDDDGNQDGQADTTESGGSSSSPLPDGFDFGDDFPTASSLIDELADLPMPAGAVFGVGSANTARQDPRETAVQQVYFDLSVVEAFVFFIDELPKAGFTIIENGTWTEAEVAEFGQAVIVFERDGIPAQFVMAPGTDATSSININMFMSGDR